MIRISIINIIVIIISHIFPALSAPYPILRPKTTSNKQNTSWGHEQVATESLLKHHWSSTCLKRKAEAYRGLLNRNTEYEYLNKISEWKPDNH